MNACACGLCYFMFYVVGRVVVIKFSTFLACFFALLCVCK
jgi:hypothetical protein